MTKKIKQSEEKKGYAQELEFANGISVSFQNTIVQMKGPQGQAQRKFFDKNITLHVTGNTIVISSPIKNKRIKTIINAFTAHIKNMIHGITQPYVYRLKVCSGHFPMKVTLEDKKFVIRNFLGEKVPRVLAYNPAAKIAIEGDIITVESPDKEIAGQTAASIEQLTRRTGYDTRIFQDGIYVVNKDGKQLK